MRIFKFLSNKLQINLKLLFSTYKLYSIYTKYTKEKIYSVILKRGKEVGDILENIIKSLIETVIKANECRKWLNLMEYYIRKGSIVYNNKDRKFY